MIAPKASSDGLCAHADAFHCMLVPRLRVAPAYHGAAWLHHRRETPTVGELLAEAMRTRFVESWNQADRAAYGDGYWLDAELVDLHRTDLL